MSEIGNAGAATFADSERWSAEVLEVNPTDDVADPYEQ